MAVPERLRPLLGALAGRLASQQASRPPRGVVALVVVALVVGAIFAVRSLPADLDSFTWWPLIVMVVITLPGIALNGYEYAISAQIGGTSVEYRAAVRVALYGTAANLLPVPGASLVRIEAMRRSGAGLGRATAATAAVGLAWLGVSVLLAGLLLIPRGLLAVPFLGAGAACTAVVWVLVSRGVHRRVARANAARIAVVEVAFVALGALRLGLALVALGAPASPATAFTLGVATAVAAATGFLPGGLGLREAIAAALGPLVGLDPAAAFLAVVMDRAVSLAVVAVVAAVVLNLRGPSSAAEVVTDGVED